MITTVYAAKIWPLFRSIKRSYTAEGILEARFGLLDDEGRQVLPNEYHRISLQFDSTLIVPKGWEIIASEAAIKNLPCTCTSAASAGSGRARKSLPTTNQPRTPTRLVAGFCHPRRPLRSLQRQYRWHRPRRYSHPKPGPAARPDPHGLHAKRKRLSPLVNRPP